MISRKTLVLMSGGQMMGGAFRTRFSGDPGFWSGVLKFGKSVLGIGAQRVKTVMAGPAGPAIRTGAAVAAGAAIEGAVQTIFGKGGRPKAIVTAQGKIVHLHRRSRGITGTELRGFRKVATLLKRYGGVARHTHFRRRR